MEDRNLYILPPITPEKLDTLLNFVPLHDAIFIEVVEIPNCKRLPFHNHNKDLPEAMLYGDYTPHDLIIDFVVEKIVGVLGMGYSLFQTFSDLVQLGKGMGI